VIEVGEGNKKQTTVTAITIYNTDPQVSSKTRHVDTLDPQKTTSRIAQREEAASPWSLKTHLRHLSQNTLQHTRHTRKRGERLKILSSRVRLQYRIGRLIAVNSAYISYGVKGGSIRVIHQATGLRLLQKGHATSDLADVALSCASGDSCLMSSISDDGDLFIWTLALEDRCNTALRMLVHGVCVHDSARMILQNLDRIPDQLTRFSCAHVNRFRTASTSLPP
jgi:hypothetical protein